jgi:ATP-dependent RNA helicase DeaD
MQVALAAVKLAHEATSGGADEEEIPEVAAPPVRADRARRPDSGRPGGRPGGNRPGGPMTRLYIAAGRSSGLRPQDLVGAIANESRLSGRDIGAIEITDRFSLVEVPEDAAAEVISALQSTRVKGKKVQVRLDRDGKR